MLFGLSVFGYRRVMATFTSNFKIQNTRWQTELDPVTRGSYVANKSHYGSYCWALALTWHNRWSVGSSVPSSLCFSISPTDNNIVPYLSCLLTAPAQVLQRGPTIQSISQLQSTAVQYRTVQCRTVQNRAVLQCMALQQLHCKRGRSCLGLTGCQFSPFCICCQSWLHQSAVLLSNVLKWSAERGNKTQCRAAQYSAAQFNRAQYRAVRWKAGFC